MTDAGEVTQGVEAEACQGQEVVEVEGGLLYDLADNCGFMIFCKLSMHRI